MSEVKADFGGWATKHGILCTDGRTIMKDAFADDNGRTVPLVWQHMHDDPKNILGHAVLENREEGVYANCFFNDTPNAKTAKNLVQHKDITALSIYANQLKQKGGSVLHGVIREVSLVLSGANIGATIDNVVMAHGDSMDELEDEVIIYNEDGTLSLEHSAEEKEDSKEDIKMADNKPAGDDRTVKEIYDSMDEDQKLVCNYLIDEAVKAATGDDDEEEDDEAEHGDNDGEVLTMKRNVFDSEYEAQENTLTHADQAKIIERAKKLGSMKEAWEEACEENEALQHDVFNDDGTKQTYGIANIDYLFPDYQTLNNTPDMIRRAADWVNVVMNGVRKTPFARIKTVHANITMDEARALGYVTGTQKKDEVFNLLRRTVDPQTVYKRQKFDRDDIIDITDFDVVSWTKAEMREMLNEEVARAALIGDGRSSDDPYKIKEDHIKPVWTDDDLYAIKINVTVGSDDAATAKNAITAMIKNRYKYKGSGNLVFFTAESWLSEMLLIEDQIGHRLYKDVNELATAMRVGRIVTVPQFENLTRTVGGVAKKLVGIALDLKDYTFGSNRRGAVEMFDDFDIDFNQYIYLIETRLSGMLVKPFSAMVLETGSAGPVYSAASPESDANPKALGYYEKEGDVYRKSVDTEVVTGKTYYTRGAY